MAWRPSEVGRLLKNDQLTDPWLRWKEARIRSWHQAIPLYVVLVLGFGFLVGLAGRHVEPWMAAAIGVSCIPFAWVELTCYYYAFIIGMALLYSKREEVGVWLLLLTAFSEFAALAPLRGMASWLDEQYTLISFATVAVFAFIVWMFHAPEAVAVEAGERAPATQQPQSKTTGGGRAVARNSGKARAAQR